MKSSLDRLASTFSILGAAMLPAPLRRWLSRLGRRLRERSEGSPLLFIGVVLAIAVLFRFTVDALRPAREPVAAAEPWQASASGAAPTMTATSEASETTPASVAAPSHTDDVRIAATPVMATPLRGSSPPAPAPARRKPRGHGASGGQRPSSRSPRAPLVRAAPREEGPARE